MAAIASCGVGGWPRRSLVGKETFLSLPGGQPLCRSCVYLTYDNYILGAGLHELFIFSHFNILFKLFRLI